MTNLWLVISSYQLSVDSQKQKLLLPTAVLESVELAQYFVHQLDFTGQFL